MSRYPRQISFAQVRPFQNPYSVSSNLTEGTVPSQQNAEISSGGTRAACTARRYPAYAPTMLKPAMPATPGNAATRMSLVVADLRYSEYPTGKSPVYLGLKHSATMDFSCGAGAVGVSQSTVRDDVAEVE